MTTPLKLIPAADAESASPWSVAEWLNTNDTPSISGLRGSVVALHVFQMLCPGCVAHGIPQAQRISALFRPEEVCVLGLHSVFEHHAAMSPVSLKAFLHEYRVSFPVGIDEAGVGSPIPKTMAAYQMRGTPTLILIDKSGRLRLHVFGRPDDMAMGAALANLIAERPEEHSKDEASVDGQGERSHGATSERRDCDDTGCRLEE